MEFVRRIAWIWPYVLAGTFLTMVIVVQAGMKQGISPFGSQTGYFEALMSVASLAGLLVAGAGAFVSYQTSQEQLAQMRTADLAGRFQKGVELLAETSMTARLGGIVILRDVARAEGQQYAQTVRSLLIAYLEDQCREHNSICGSYAHPPGSTEYAQVSESQITHWELIPFPKIEAAQSDIVEAFKVIGDSTIERDGGTIEVRGAVFFNAKFRNLDMTGVRFTECYFAGTLFRECNFHNAMFRGGVLGLVNMIDCDLSQTVILPARNNEDRSAGGTLIAHECDLSFGYIDVDATIITESNVTGHVFGHTNVRLNRCWRMGRNITLHGETVPDARAIDATNLTPRRRTARGMPVY